MWWGQFPERYIYIRQMIKADYSTGLSVYVWHCLFISKAIKLLGKREILLLSGVVMLNTLLLLLRSILKRLCTGESRQRMGAKYRRSGHKSLYRAVNPLVSSPTLTWVMPGSQMLTYLQKKEASSWMMLATWCGRTGANLSEFWHLEELSNVHTACVHPESSQPISLFPLHKYQKTAKNHEIFR